MILPTIGELTEKVDILNVAPPYSVDGSGTIVSTFRSNVRAKIVPLGGINIIETQQSQAYVQRYDVWIRRLTGVTSFQQLDWSGTRLAMTAPPETFGASNPRWILIHAEARNSRKI